MRKLLLLILFTGVVKEGIGQTELPGVKNLANTKGVVIKREQGEYRDTRTKHRLGSFALLYIIDTIHHHLLHVTLSDKKRDGEFTYMFNYTNNKLTQASSGVIERGVVRIFKNYAYEEEDYLLSEKDLQALSESDERLGLLKESRTYLSVLKKYKP